MNKRLEAVNALVVDPAHMGSLSKADQKAALESLNAAKASATRDDLARVWHHLTRQTLFDAWQMSEQGKGRRE